MSIILNKNARAMVQGITGKEGQRATKEMIASGIAISCGVTPGKGGQTVEDVHVFDSVREAKEHDAHINTSVIYVPPLMVYDAALEAINNRIETIVIVTENVPVKDTAKLVEMARYHNCRIIGPSSIGILNTRLGKLGSIATANEKSMYTAGNVALISKSGGMCGETANILTRAGFGQSTVIGIGGDVIIGTTYADLIPLLEKDNETEAIVVFGEIGGTYEEQLADYVKEHGCSKPVIAFISGKFVETINRDLPLGHAGAIISYGKGKADDKKAALRAAGVIVADYHDDIPALVKKALEKKIEQTLMV
ncbi:MAG: succinate--CoA ligase subunit alpha [Candidatus Woesearchaeota archaeon]|nr:succinate--CoA ligase subunit alpha [Candidatus Woesearchaeota archaeon]